MKVMREKESFKPVTIVLESQDELDWLFCCLAGSSVSGVNRAYANEFGKTTQRFPAVAVIGVDMYEAVREIVEGK
jgi:hypothetical protein